MPTFLFTAVNPEGIKITDRIDGGTVSAARYKLETQGFSQINFHTDDMERHAEAAFAEGPEPPPRDVLSPEQELEARRGGGVIREIWVAWKRHAVLWVPLAVWNGLTLAEGRPYGFGDWIGFSLCGAFLLYFLWIVLPSVAYQKLLEAGVWYRWNELHRWVRFIRVLKRFGFVVQGMLSEIKAYRAIALANLGFNDDARRLIREAEPLLKARRDTVLLDRCRHSLPVG